MEMKGFPTSADIYLELDGRKVAVVQGYTAKAAKSSRFVEAFGESEPVAAIEGQRKYTLELTRLYATDDAVSDGIDFYNLEDFSLVIWKRGASAFSRTGRSWHCCAAWQRSGPPERRTPPLTRGALRPCGRIEIWTMRERSFCARGACWRSCFWALGNLQ